MVSTHKFAVAGTLIVFLVVAGLFTAQRVGVDSTIIGSMTKEDVVHAKAQEIKLAGDFEELVSEDVVVSFTSNSKKVTMGHISTVTFESYDRYKIDTRDSVWKNASDTFDVIYKNGVVTITEYDEIGLPVVTEFEVGMSTDSEVETAIDNLGYTADIVIKKESYGYLFDLQANGINTTTKDSLDTFYIKKKSGTSKQDNNKLNLGRELNMNFKEAVSQGFTIDSIDDNEIRLGNLSANVRNGELYIDPTIEFTGNNATVDDAAMDSVDAGSYGTCAFGYCFSGGGVNTDDHIIRGLLRFNSVVENIPADAVVTFVNITMNWNTDAWCRNDQGGANTLEVYRLLENFSETGITNANYATGLAWDTAMAGGVGTDFVDEILYTKAVAFLTENVSVSGDKMISYYQGMINKTYANNGLLLKATDESTTHTVLCFAPKEHAQAAARPILILTYTVNTAPTTPTWNSPASNGTTILTNNYFVNWTNSTDPDGDAITYLLDIATDDDFSTIVQSNGSISETATPTGYWVTGLSDDTYYVRVRANDGTVNSSWASTYWTQQSGIATTLNIPANNTNTTSSSVTFNCSAYDPDDTITNITLIVGNVERASVAGTRNNESLQTTLDLDEGTYQWNCNATTSTGSDLATNRTLIVDTYIDVELNTPADAFNSSLASVVFNCTANSSTTINNITLFIDGVSNYTVNPASSRASISRNITLKDSAHTWTCNATTTQGESKQPTERTLTIYPMTMDLTTPTASQNFTNSTVTFNCTANSTAELLNITLVIDGVNNYTWDTGGVKYKDLVYERTFAGYEGHSHTWTCLAFDVNQFNSSSTTITFSVSNPVYSDPQTPADQLNSTTATVNFNCTANSTANLKNITLYVDGVRNYTATGFTSTIGSLSRNVTFNNLDGVNHTWSCLTHDVNEWNSTTPTRAVWIDPVSVNLNTPTTEQNLTVNDIEFNCTANSTDNLQNITLYIDGVRNYTLTTSNKIRSLKTNITMTQGGHTWYCQTFDTNLYNESATEIGFGIDSITPVINITSYNTTLVTYSDTVNVTVNWTVTDTNIADSWISYDGNNYTGVGSAGNYGLRFGLNRSRSHIYYVYANDTYGTINRTFVNTSVYRIVFNLTENLDPIMEGQTSIFTLKLNTESIPLTTARLVWNNTDYGLGSSTKTSSSTYTFIKTFTIPNGMGNSTGNKVTYYWNYSMLGVKNDSLVSNQSVINFIISKCNASYPIGIINYTLLDEETQSSAGLTNTSIAVDLLLSSADGSYTWSFSINTTENNLSICMSNLTNGSSLRLGSVAQYSSDLHEIEFHYIQDFNITRSNHTQVVRLLDLATADSTSFIVTFKDATHLPVENAIMDVWRYYIAEGRYKSVEHGKTNDQGETTLHLVAEDVIYNFYVRKDQALLWVSPDYQVVCQTSPCQLNFIQSGGFLGIPDFATVDNLDYTITTDESARTITLTYSVTDGSNSKVALTVTKLDAYMNNTVCSEVETSSGGTLTCTIPTTYANDTYLIELYTNDKFSVSELFNMDIGFEGFGSTGTLLTALLYLLLALMVIGNPIVSIVMGVFGLIIASTLMIFGGGSAFGAGSTILWLICAAGILIYKMANRSRN